METLRFLSVDDVLAIHADTMAQEGGLGGVRDPGLLDSAVMMPQQRFGGQYLHQDIAAMAAAYLFHIAQNHPFHDGNKRAAVMSALVFLDVNGITNLPTPDELEATTLSVASGQIGKRQLTDWLRERMASRFSGSCG